MSTAWLRHVPLLLATLSGVASGQTPELQPSDAVQCLSHVKGQGQQPEYPGLEFNSNQSARVQVELEFSRADRAPAVTILLQEASKPFVDAVLEHVRGLRVPCLVGSGNPARIKQDFVFASDRRQVHWSSPEETDAARRGALWSCWAHPSGWQRPAYPEWARRQGVQGRVLARLRFANASDPPTIEVFSRKSARGLADEVQAWLKDSRLPCQVNGPITFVVAYQYLFEGERYGFNDLDFKTFLFSAKGIRNQTLTLDTHTMGCPFDLRINYRQPLLPNAVGELGPSNPARRPLLEWVAATELNADRDSSDAIFAADAKITIPCLKIDLKPQEKS